MGILRDHAFFILSSLGPKEREAILQADRLRGTFGNLLKKAASAAVDEAGDAAEELISFKKEILKRLVNCRVVIHLLPSDLNQMINEAQEFLRILGRLPGMPQNTPELIIHLNRLWVFDAAGHSSMLYRTLDVTEERSIKRLRDFEHDFNLHYLKTDVKDQIYDKLKQDFPSLHALADESRRLVQPHIEMLRSLEKQIQGCTIETNASFLMPNHMIREETYFLNKLSQIIDAR